MNFKIFASIFVGLLTVNLSVQSPLGDSVIKVVVVKIIDKALEISDFVLKEANAVVDIIEKDQDGIKDRIVDYAIKVGKDVNAVFLHTIDELKDGATEQAKAVLDCIEGEEQKTEDAFSHIYADIGTCAAGESPKVLGEVRNILKQFKELHDDVQTNTDALGACTQSDMACFLRYFASMAKTAIKIPSVVWEDVEDVFRLVKTIIDDVNGCSGTIIKEVRSSVQDIINDAAVCMKK